MPKSVLTAYLIEVYGDKRMSAETEEYSTARAHAGPDPIDLPIRSMSFSLYFYTSIRYYMTSWAFIIRVSASAYSVRYMPYPGYSTAITLH